MTSTGEPFGAAHVAPKRRVGNLLGLAVLSYLTQGPMHPYQLSRTLRDNGDARSIKFNHGSQKGADGSSDFGRSQRT